MSIDLIIVSDSHGNALVAGAKRLGLQVRQIGFSGAGWHRREFSYTKAGLRIGKVPAAKRALAALQQELGAENIMTAGVPVVTTLGFHLGQMVPPFGWNLHVTDPDEMNRQQDQLFASEAFTREYIEAFRLPHFMAARRMSKAGKLMVIPPPAAHDRTNYAAFRALIVDEMHRYRIPVHDPMTELAGPNGLLPPELIAPDGTHANDDYGVLVIEQLRASGWLAA